MNILLTELRNCDLQDKWISDPNGYEAERATQTHEGIWKGRSLHLISQQRKVEKWLKWQEDKMIYIYKWNPYSLKLKKKKTTTKNLAQYGWRCFQDFTEKEYLVLSSTHKALAVARTEDCTVICQSERRSNNIFHKLKKELH